MKYFFLFTMAFVACHAPSSTTSINSLKSAKDSSSVKPLHVIEPDSAPNVFRIHFPPDSIEVTFEGMVDSPRQRQTYIFHAKKTQLLDGEIIPDSAVANIRFNQIFTPAGASDGPFGLTIHYALNETGDYRLIIAESMMGEAWTGKYAVHLKIK